MGQTYLNFIDQDPNQSHLRFTSQYAETEDARVNAVEFGGPPTVKGLKEKRQAEIDAQLLRAAEEGW